MQTFKVKFKTQVSLCFFRQSTILSEQSRPFSESLQLLTTHMMYTVSTQNDLTATNIILVFFIYSVDQCHFCYGLKNFFPHDPAHAYY